MRDEESHTFFENLLVTFGEKANGGEVCRQPVQQNLAHRLSCQRSQHHPRRRNVHIEVVTEECAIRQKWSRRNQAALTAMRAARELGLDLTTISTSCPSATRKYIKRSTEKPSNL
jgi:hypothetical protein